VAWLKFYADERERWPQLHVHGEGKRIRERLDQAERLYWLLYRAGMNNQDCARRFGVSAREVRRWRSWLRQGL